MIHIRVASEKDLSLLVSLGKDTFLAAFAKDNTKDNMDAYISTAFSSERINEELNDTSSRFFLAYDQQTPVGYAKVRESEEVKDTFDEPAIELERIYIVAGYQGKKIGALLLQTCLNHAKEKNFKWLWLGVWEHNIKALDFYKRWGFEKFGEHPFRLGTDMQTDWLMKKRIE